MTKQQKVDDNKLYAYQQMERFLWKNYRYVMDGLDVYIDKDTKYKKVMTELSMNDNGVCDGFVLSYYLLQKSKPKILEYVFHECIHYALYRQGKAYLDGQPTFEAELVKYGLEHTSTGGVQEGWADLHTYICSKCKKIKFLKQEKIPKSKDPVYNEYLTSCCHAPFLYKGNVRYTNKKLQEIKGKVKKREEIKRNR